MDDPALDRSLVTMVAALRACANAIEQIALSLQANGTTQRTTAHDGERWPDVMTTAVAARYCGYKSASAIRKAHHDGRLLPVGRRGAKGTCTWAKADLDNYLRGGEPVRSSVSGSTAAAIVSAATPARRRRRRTRPAAKSPELERVLQRLREVAKIPL